MSPPRGGFHSLHSGSFRSGLAVDRDAPSEKERVSFTGPVFLSHTLVTMLGISLKDPELSSALLEVKIVDLRGDGVGPWSRLCLSCVRCGQRQIPS